jgi:hypothetical protein
VRKVGLPKWLLWSHGAACALLVFVLVLSPQHMEYETLVPSARWLEIAGAAAVATLLLVVLLIRWGGIAQVRNATLIPVVGMMIFLLGFYGKELDLNYSARPLAREMARDDPGVRLVAVHDVRRDMVYGLAFYRNEEPIEYARDGVPAQEHLLVVPTREAGQLESWLAGRVYEPQFLYESQGLEVYKVYAKQ